MTSSTMRGTAGVLLAVSLTSLATTSQGALVGRLPATPGGMDYQAYYDTDLNITWLADANLAASKSFGISSSSITYGRMDWFTALAWVSNMNLFEYLGANDWRLPATLENDPSCTIDAAGTVPAPPGSDSGMNCTGSELGHLFYEEFGAAAGTSATDTGDPAVLAKFTNLQDSYWSGTESTVHPGSAWSFSFSSGIQSGGLGKYDSNSTYVWAVHDGDIGAVPVPAAAWLFGGGLSGLIGIGLRRRTRNPLH